MPIPLFPKHNDRFCKELFSTQKCRSICNCTRPDPKGASEPKALCERSSAVVVAGICEGTLDRSRPVQLRKVFSHIQGSGQARVEETMCDPHRYKNRTALSVCGNSDTDITSPVECRRQRTRNLKYVCSFK